jgi:hypothetical protein
MKDYHLYLKMERDLESITDNIPIGINRNIENPVDFYQDVLHRYRNLMIDLCPLVHRRYIRTKSGQRDLNPNAFCFYYRGKCIIFDGSREVVLEERTPDRYLLGASLNETRPSRGKEERCSIHHLLPVVPNIFWSITIFVLTGGELPLEWREIDYLNTGDMIISMGSFFVKNGDGFLQFLGEEGPLITDEITRWIESPLVFYSDLVQELPGTFIELDPIVHLEHLAKVTGGRTIFPNSKIFWRSGFHFIRIFENQDPEDEDKYTFLFEHTPDLYLLGREPELDPYLEEYRNAVQNYTDRENFEVGTRAALYQDSFHFNVG